MDRELICQIATAVIGRLSRKVERPVPMPALEITLFHIMCTTVEAHGVLLREHRTGPWRVDTTGKLAAAVPVIHRGEFSMTDHEMSWGIAGLLNWCGVEEPTADPTSD
jgi:hypothetical protein